MIIPTRPALGTPSVANLPAHDGDPAAVELGAVQGYWVHALARWVWAIVDDYDSDNPEFPASGFGHFPADTVIYLPIAGQDPAHHLLIRAQVGSAVTSGLSVTPVYSLDR